MTKCNASSNDWTAEMTSMLGKQVRVTLNHDDKDAVVTGQLLSFSEDGEIVILDEVGIKHWCWPNLECEET